MSKVPTFPWGGRVVNAPPTLGFPGWLNINTTHDFAISLTKVMGRHTIKAGFYNTHSYKAEQVGNQAFGTINFPQDAVGTNPFDTSFGFANAAIGAFSSFQQAQRYVETRFGLQQPEGYIQDNWKVNDRLTLDYGMRFVHQQAAVRQARSGVELPAREVGARRGAGAVRRRAALAARPPAPAATAQAMNPRDGAVPRSELGARDRHARPGLRQHAERAVPAGQEASPKATYTAPALAFAPRFGMAYDLTRRAEDRPARRRSACSSTGRSTTPSPAA